MDQNARPRYYDGEYLSADDLEAIVRYARVAEARHALGAHLWGIAIGLDLAERDLGGGDVEMVLTPGVAWDGYARALIAPAPQRLPLDAFANFQDDTLPEGIPIEVWIAYRELPASPPGVGFSCPEDALYGRVVESFRILLRRVPVSDYHSVSIASRTVEARNALVTFDAGKGTLYDESVAQQMFPESGDKQPWPLFVGIVRWKKDTGVPGKLIKRTDDDRNQTRQGRPYVGLVAETIAAPGGVLRLRDRAKDPNDPNLNFKPPIVAAPAGTTVVNDLVWCEGHLRVVGDARLQPSAAGQDDGKLDFRIAKGGDDSVPIHLRRTFAAGAPSKTTLDAFVGPPPPAVGGATAQTRFTVSTKDGAGNAKECLTVVTDGRVGVNAADPAAVLDVHSDAAVQGNIRLFTAAADFEYDGGSDQLFVFKDTGGKTAFLGGDIGIGTKAPLSRLHVAQDAHLNAVFERSDLQEHLTVVVGSQGSGLRFSDTNEFFVASQAYADRGDTTFGTEHLRIKANGNVGIGTTNPATALHVVGQRLRLEGNGKRIDLRTDGAAVDLHSETDNLYIRSSGVGGKNNVIINPIAGDGNVGIGTQTPAVKLDIFGAMRLNGDAFIAAGFGWWTTSDQNEKESIRSIQRPLEKLLALKGVGFRWRGGQKGAASGTREYGFVAQDVETVFPEWVKETPWGTKSVNVGGLNALLVEAMRELAGRCERLEAEVAELRARLDKTAGASAGKTPRTSRPRAKKRSPPAS
jgi:Chaperone of endosialidase